jgi:hypothetical protein
MWRRVGLVKTDISVERIVSIFRIEQSTSEEDGQWYTNWQFTYR